MGPSTSAPIDPTNPLPGQPRGHSTAASDAAGARTAFDAGGQFSTAGSIAAGAGAGGALALGPACSASRSPSPIPGTPGADPEVAEHCHLINRIDPTRTESSSNDYFESLDPAGLAAEFRRFVGPKAPTLSSQEISAELRRYVAYHEAPVAPPERQVEVNRLSQTSSHVGRNNKTQIQSSKVNQPSKRSSSCQKSKCLKRQKVAADQEGKYTGTETETESETEHTESETETEQSSPGYQPVFPTYSPPPLPREHVSSVTNTLGLLGLPSGQPAIASLGTTRASTQPRPADKQPPRPTPSMLASANSRIPINNKPPPTKKPSPPVRSKGIMGAISGSSADLLKFIQSSGELAQALRELHRRQKVAKASGVALEDVGPMRSQSEQLEEDLVPDNEKERSAKAAKAVGELPSGRKPKPTSRDLHGYERQLISSAKMHLLAYALKNGVIQTRPTFVEWSDKSWLTIWGEQLPNLPPQVASTMVKQIMVNNLATGRGRFKDPVRPLVQHTLKLIKPALTDEDVQYNLEIFFSVHPNTFHCKQFSPPSGHYESDLLTNAIATTMFSGPNAVGVVYKEFFNPMPLTTVAFVLAIVQFCIEEYETGNFRPHDLSMTDLLNKYVAHLRGLKEASAAAKKRMARLQQHWHDYGLKYSGTSNVGEDVYQPITQRRDVRPDTPEPESEDENEAETTQHSDDEHAPEMNEEGRYTMQAKGKNPA
ncbi:hypothetical protein FS749_016466, partial [Ceratobasidium sp. UAMH 11750]